MAQVTSSRAEALAIGELSRLTGVNIETIRYYEKVKLLPAPLRTKGGHRLYGPRERRTLAFIRRARELGFTLDEIRALLELGAPGSASCAEVKEIAAHHLGDIRAKIADLKKLERLLASTIAKCSDARFQTVPWSIFSTSLRARSICQDIDRCEHRLCCVCCCSSSEFLDAADARITSA